MKFKQGLLGAISGILVCATALYATSSVLEHVHKPRTNKSQVVQQIQKQAPEKLEDELVEIDNQKLINRFYDIGWNYEGAYNKAPEYNLNLESLIKDEEGTTKLSNELYQRLLKEPKAKTVMFKGKEYKPFKVKAVITAYSPDEKGLGKGGHKFADGKTSIGDNAWILNGVSGAKKQETRNKLGYSYRDKIAIPGFGIKEIDDCGGDMEKTHKRGGIRLKKGWVNTQYHFDVRMASAKRANQFGEQIRIVTIYKRIN